MAEGSPGEASAPIARPVQPQGPHGRGPRRNRTVGVLAVGLVVVLVVIAVVWWDRRDRSSAPASPTAVQVRLAEGRRPAVTVSFEAVAGAEAYMVRFDDETADPIRVEGSTCRDRRCELTIHRMTAGQAGAVTVTALGPDGASGASQPATFPEWPAVEEQPDPWPEDGPVGLVVVREGEGGRPEYGTEMVEAGEDIQARVEARIAELQAAEGVLSVAVDLPLQLHQSTRGEGHIPAGLATWQTLAWDYESIPTDLDGSGVTVAVIDVGFQLDHPALQGADIGPVVSAGDPDASNADALDADFDHGTSVTSFIVGRPGSGVPGVAPAATVRPYSLYTDDFLELLVSGDAVLVSDLAETIVQAVDDGADVISMSLSFGCWRFGGPDQPDWCPDTTLAPAVEYAESRGVVLTAAAPNDGLAPHCDGEGDPHRSNQNAWPAMVETVVAVGGSSRDGARFVCSPEREYLDVLAPAHALQVASRNGYEVASGTSYATPLVAGLVALVLQARPDMTPAEVRALLAEARIDDGRVIPLDVMDRLGRLDQATTTAGDTYLLADAMVRDADWPYRGAALSLNATSDDGRADSVLTDALGEPAATDPASWGGNQRPDDPRPVPGEGTDPAPPECWSGLYGLATWEEDGAPLLAVLYARDELPLDSGATVPAGALLGYRAFQESARVQMADGIAIGRTQAELEAFYQEGGQPHREVSFVDDGGEFELVTAGAPNPTAPHPTGPAREESPGPDLGRMSGTADPRRDTILERGAGSQCGLDADTVAGLIGAGSNGGGGDGGRGRSGACDARVGIVLDASPSIVDAGAEDQVRGAATGVVDALGETGAEVRISSFTGFPVSLTSGWVSLADPEGRRLARQVVGSLAFEGHGTNWEAALMDLAGQSADVVVFVTDGNPNEYGVGITSSPSADATTDFDPVALAAGVAAAELLRGDGTRIVAVGAGDVRADSLAQVAGPTEGEDYYAGDFADLGPSLAEIATDLCGSR